MRIAYPLFVTVGLLGSTAFAQLSSDPSLGQYDTYSQTTSSAPAPAAAATPMETYASTKKGNNKGNGGVDDFPHLSSESSSYTGKVRNYYIQIGEYNWDYLISGKDLYHGGPPEDGPAKTWFAKSKKTIGSQYVKAFYRAFTDSTFKTPLPHDPSLGTLGPMIRAEVGDQINVLVSNSASFNFSMHPHGVKYTLANEGAVYEGAAMSAIVPPGGTYTYQWFVPARAGPGPQDGSSILWGYHSHTSEAADLYAGLTGAIIIYNPGSLGKNGLPKDLDREYVLQALVFDENQSPYFLRNVKAAKIPASALGTDAFAESNKKHTLNGFAFNNLPGITMKVGERVRIYMMAFGNEPDVHSINFHGNTALLDSHRVDTIELLPATFRTIDMVPDNPGQWLIQCETTDHTIGGMIASYQVLPGKGKGKKGKGKGKPTHKGKKKPKTH